MAPGARVRLGGADPVAATDPSIPAALHQSGDLIALHVMACPTCRFPQLVRPVDAVVVLPQLDKGRTQDGVALGPLRQAAGLGRVVVLGATDTLLIAGRCRWLDPEPLAVVVDEIDYFLCWRSSSAPEETGCSFPESRWLSEGLSRLSTM